MAAISHDKKDFGKVIPFASPYRPRTESQALQEIINVLKHPFMTSCDACNGLGFIKSGEDCPTCFGSGRVIDEVFR